MKYHIHVSEFGSLPYWITAPNGTVVATHKELKRAERVTALLNSNPEWLKDADN